MANIKEALENNYQKLALPYPGRGIIVGLDESGACWRQLSFIGGRSEGSKNRIYRFSNDSGISLSQAVQTDYFDPTKDQGDPEKVIYNTMLSNDFCHVVSNGRQTDTIAEDLVHGSSFDDAQKRWENEGLSGGYTSRITGVIYSNSKHFLMGRISHNPLNTDLSIYSSFKLDAIPGYGYFLTTYDGAGGLEPSRLEPTPISLAGSLEDNLNRLWETLDPKTRVAAAAREIERGSGRLKYIPFKNANLGD
ncbi:MAG: IMP cyclohydrolase [Candidatus Daviesbacteria bacterium]|nr:IMP cyclohydrolase [Candidatus Daviesbacteria bacterium]